MYGHRMRSYLVLNSGKSRSHDEPDGDEGDTHHHVHHHHHGKHEGDTHHVANRSVPVSALAAVQDRVGNPPATWGAYDGHPDAMRSIIDMEKHELVQAYASGDVHAIKKELTDLAAACVCALKAM